MKTDPAMLTAVGSITSTDAPYTRTASYCAQFHKESPEGRWVRGTGEEAVFTSKDVAFEWLCEMGCLGLNGSITIH